MARKACCRPCSCVLHEGGLTLCKTFGKFNKAHTAESLSSCCYQAELCRKQLVFLQKSYSLTLHQSLKNPKTTKSLFSAQSIDGSEAFDLKNCLLAERGSLSSQRAFFVCSGNCFKQGILKRMWILERYKRACMPEYLSISSNCTDWSNKRLLDLSVQSCLYSRGSTSDTLMTPSKLHAFLNSSLRQRLAIWGPEWKVKRKKTTQCVTKVWRIQTTKVQVRMTQIKW